MTYLHDKCEGEIELIHDNYGLCTTCGDEGQYVSIEELDDRTIIVSIPQPTCNRLED